MSAIVMRQRKRIFMKAWVRDLSIGTELGNKTTTV